MATAQWTDKERVEEYINNNPVLTADLLARLFGQAEVDSLYAEMFPPATPEQKERALEKARRLLVRSGYAETTALVRDINSELADIRMVIGG